RLAISSGTSRRSWYAARTSGLGQAASAENSGAENSGATPELALALGAPMVSPPSRGARGLESFARRWRASAFSKMGSRSSGTMDVSLVRTAAASDLASRDHDVGLAGFGGVVRGSNLSRSMGASSEAYWKHRAICASLKPGWDGPPLTGALSLRSAASTLRR